MAARAARARGAGRVVVAVPVASPEAARRLPGVDQVIALLTPPGFSAVGAHYLDFAEVGDDEVVELLDAARRRMDAVGHPREWSGGGQLSG